MSRTALTYKNHRYPIESWPALFGSSSWFNLSLRDVEEMLLERGIVVSYETIRRWCRKHGPEYARRLRRKPPSKDDVWHLDEVVVRINDQKRRHGCCRSGRICARRRSSIRVATPRLPSVC